VSAPRPTELFVADLDGTLLGPDARLSAFAREALERILQAGAHFTVASARSVQSMRPILGDLPLRLPVVTLNGAILSDLRTARHVRVVSVAVGALRVVMDAAAGLGLKPFITSFDGARDNLYIPPPANDGAAWYLANRREARDPRLRGEYDLDVWLAEQVVSLTFIDTRARLEPLVEAVDRSGLPLALAFTPHIYTSGWYWLTVHSGEASKDGAVRDLQRRHGLQGCPVVAFGDQANDVPLLRAADHGVAVGNADPEARAAAREIIGPNTEDSVPRYILRRLGLG
jgi:hypothetical protein